MQGDFLAAEDAAKGLVWDLVDRPANAVDSAGSADEPHLSTGQV